MVQRSHPRTAWLEAGIRLLASEGHRALRLSRLCEETGLSTGSFYWHFRSADDFKKALPEYWVEIVLPRIFQRAMEDAPEKGVKRLTDSIRAENGHLLDAAMREWTGSNAHARKALARANTFRREALRAASPDGLSDDQIALFAMAWQGSIDMRDQDSRFRILEQAIHSSPPSDPDSRPLLRGTSFIPEDRAISR